MTVVENGAGDFADPNGTSLAVHAPDASQIWLCLFDEADCESRIPLARDGDMHRGPLPAPGTRYGLRADGPYDPSAGLWFDPAKLLLDPCAVEIDRRFTHHPALAAPRDAAIDTAPLMPKAIVPVALPPLAVEQPRFANGGLIYELNVRGFTMRHPDIPAALRDTIAALAHPAVIAHLKALHVSAVELMPVTAAIDERHLPPLGLANAWGYNPVGFMALDPRLAPGGVAELRETVAALHAAGIATILDLVFNHTGESDALGPTLSLRGLDARGYYRHAAGSMLVNDTGCGNTIACDAPAARRLILASLRHFAAAGVDGFRFDLAPILGRTAAGFDPHAALLREIADDPLLAARILIAEPWDIGPGGYQLGRFPPNFLEWNDCFRDDVRRFWRGDDHAIGAFATRLAGSADIFGDGPATRTVNFIAAHDGFTLADIVAHAHKHNEANGETNHDGHDENLSWNNGIEGESDDPAVATARRRDVAALLATLFASRGTIMLTAGDEFGRSQRGNNNAYAQDNDITWLDWDDRDHELESTAFALAKARAAMPSLTDPAFATSAGVVWLRPDGVPFGEADWHRPDTGAVAMILPDGGAVLINRTNEAVRFDIAMPATNVPARSVLLAPSSQQGSESTSVAPAITA